MKNQVIKALNEEHGKKVIEYWRNKGIQTRNLKGTATAPNWCYYGIINGIFDNYLLGSVIHNNAEIIELPTENPYPKVMWVWEVPSNKNKRVVIAHQSNKYIAWNSCETIEESIYAYNTTAWCNAEDIQEETIVELTLEDISAGKGVGVPIHLLRIKQ